MCSLDRLITFHCETRLCGMVVCLLFLNMFTPILVGNTPLHYAACGGYEDVVRVLIKGGANVEEHNENGHTPLMEAASAGKVNVAKILLEAGAGINTHSNEFKESALTLACYKGKSGSTEVSWGGNLRGYCASMTVLVF